MLDQEPLKLVVRSVLNFIQEECQIEKEVEYSNKHKTNDCSPITTPKTPISQPTTEQYNQT